MLKWIHIYFLHLILLAAPCAIAADWDADEFSFCAMILYQIRVKHVSNCYHMVTSI